jgi:hypothetical protein
MQQDGDRDSQIRAFCAKRGIKRLVHFARVENLSAILRDGLLSRRALETLSRERRPRFNDPVRLDGHTEAICLSIEFPNAPMFHRYARDDPAAWVVLCLDTTPLWELDCAFCRQNASSNVVRDAPLSARKTFYALRQMYAEHTYDVRRRALWIPARSPTNPQAEVPVIDPIRHPAGLFLQRQGQAEVAAGSSGPPDAGPGEHTHAL